MNQSTHRGLPLVLLCTGAMLASSLAGDDDVWMPQAFSAPFWACEKIVAPPSSPSVLYAGCSSSESAGDLYRSTNRGVSWARLVNGLGGVPIDALAVDATDPLRLYAGSASAFGVYISADGGDSWTVNHDLGIVRHLVADPRQPSVLYAVSYSGFDRSGGLFRSEDGGSTWSELLAPRDIQVLVIDPRTGALYLGTMGEPGVTGPGGLFASENRAASWTRLDLGIEATSEPFHAQTTVAIAAGPRPGILYVATESYGVRRTTDGGQSWKRIDGGMPLGVRQLVVDPKQPETVYAVGPGAVFRSINRGATWEPFASGLSESVVALAARIEEPGRGSVLYAGTERGFRGVFRLQTATETDILLNHDRFRVSLSWRDSDGRTGVGLPQRLSDDSADFWFFSPANIEVTVKVLDGRGINGAFWVFYGSLSNVEFSLTVTDTLTDRTRVYDNPLGNLASVADTSAFPE